MKLSIKTTVGIIAIALSSITIAQAGQNRHERDYDRDDNRGYLRNVEKPRHQSHFRKHERRQHWKRNHRAQHRYDRYRENRHFRQHHNYNRHAKRHMRAYDRIRRNHSGWKRGHHRVEKRFYRNSYISPRHSSPRVSISTHLHSNNALPTIAGGLIGSAIANDASHGDPGATFGGAIVGAIVGNVIAHH